MQFEVHADIAKAETLSSAFYTDPSVYERSKSSIFGRSWQLIADVDDVRTPGSVYPVTMLDGFVDEPLVVTRDQDDQIHCLSNVCTHRGNLVAEHPGRASCLACPYHGRRFELDGRLRSMPGFDAVENFPSERDHLPKLSHALWRRFVFASLGPSVPVETMTSELDRRVGFLPIEEARVDRTRCRDYLVKAHWALYCDNYLEGFHIPFVHASLGAELDYGEYTTELAERTVLQVGVSKSGENTFDLPEGSPESGQDIAAYYFWLYPNTMLNFYPWGISVNVVRPLGVALTKVSYLTYVWDESLMDSGAGAELDRVEREDHSVVESVQRGLRSRLYDRGRYSVEHERGVHRFHQLLTADLASG